MSFITFFLLLAALLVGSWIAGKRSDKNEGKEDYFLAKRSVKLFPLFMTFLATQVGGGLVLGSAEEAYRYGWIVFLYPLGASLGLIVLGLGIGRKLSEFKVSTTAQILEVVYGSALLKKIGSILSIVSLFMILVAQIIASSKFLISLGVDSHLIFYATWAVVILYTVRGLKAVIASDVVQAGFFSIVFLLTLVVICFVNHSSFSKLIDLTSASSTFAIASSKWCGWLLMPLLFMVIEQDMGQRCFAAGSGKIVSRATLFSGFVTLLVCTVPISIGMLGRSLGIVIPEGASVLMVVISKITNPIIAAAIGAAVLAAIVSTAASLINAISSNLSEDFKWKLFEKKQGLFFVKAITAFISIAALFFSSYFTNIVDLLIQSYELSVGALFVPTLAALFKKRGEFLSALLSILFGVFGFILMRWVSIGIPREVAPVLLSALGFALGEMIAYFRKGQETAKLEG